MKKIDKLIIGSFFGPFFLTFFVVIFILLSQFMLRYFDELVGKDLDGIVIGKLIFYFSVFMTPNAFPLAVLLSSLMTFGNLGEHFELTAIKGAGISLIRALVPIFIFSLGLTIAAFYSNNYIVPKANLQAFSLLYDVKQMKPSMELKEGAFYNGIENYSIKVNKKFPDDRSLKDIIIYHHSNNIGNNEVILADSGQMYNVMGGRYLVLELYNGNSFTEQKAKRRNTLKKVPEPFVRNEFKKSKMMFDLTSFGLKRTDIKLFASNKLMKNTEQLKADTDSMEIELEKMMNSTQLESLKYLDYSVHEVKGELYEKIAEQREKELQERDKMLAMSKDSLDKSEQHENQQEKDSLKNDRSRIRDSIRNIRKENRKTSNRKFETLSAKSDIRDRDLDIIDTSDNKIKNPDLLAIKNIPPNDPEIPINERVTDSASLAKEDSLTASKPDPKTVLDSLLSSDKYNKIAYTKALSNVRLLKNSLSNQITRISNLKTELNKFLHERYRKLSTAVTILIMFLIGAPLGSIIKRGGLGIPVLISISFFILFYVISMICEKWTRGDVMSPFLAAWMANIILFPVGVFFLRQAKNDARLLDMDFYNVLLFRIKKYFKKSKGKLSTDN